MFCRICGREIEADKLFCPYCGERQPVDHEYGHGARPVPVQAGAPIQAQAADPGYMQTPPPGYSQAPQGYVQTPPPGYSQAPQGYVQAPPPGYIPAPQGYVQTPPPGYAQAPVQAPPMGFAPVAGEVVKKASWVPLLVISLIAVVVIGVVVVIQFPSLFKSDEQQAREIVEEFFEAVQAGAITDATECFSPAVQEQFEGAKSASGIILSAFGLPDMSGLVNPLLGYFSQEYYQNYEFKVTTVELDSDKKSGLVYVDVYIDGEYDDTTTIPVTKYKNKWYISE